ncbi:RpnC/YadD family protein [Gracilibacillus oryzae]|uniref:Rpn family recombination-promoting nuclease/putative transposase n=1 Tax=Gracilibacillus oryzae TaxID=1672701 RepID=UPI001D195C8F|nr:Rpn family recombination-promoting nuclease/putative transposase [Gracilibacillus oryzae]
MNHTLIAVHEDSSKYLSHDQLFIQLIGTFFEEFLELFFPDVHRSIDFSDVKPLSEEWFTDLLEGDHKKVDMVFEAKLKGEEKLIIIHVEPQSYRQDFFHQRMYQYFSLLYNRYRKPV